MADEVTTKLLILGLVGNKGVGKSTLAKMLVDRGFTRIPFAGPLKSMLSQLLAMQGVNFNTINEMIEGKLKEEPTSFLCGKSPRHAMQTLGTEWGRELIGPNFWLDVWTARVLQMKTPVVVDDVRFVNEALQIEKLGGYVVKINRDTHKGHEDTHVSETQLTDIMPHHLIWNPESHPHEMIAQLLQLGIRI